MSLEMQIEGLQIFFKHQKQRSKEEIMKKKKEKTFVIFRFNFFEEKLEPSLFSKTPYLSHF
jgi:hypothetical protein